MNIIDFLYKKIGDQQASMWGSCCFAKGDVKLTLGTGSYMNVNSGSQCHASIHGLYPMIAWSCRDYENPQKKDLTYCMEGGSHDTGSIIRWAINFGMFFFFYLFLECFFNNFCFRFVYGSSRFFRYCQFRTRFGWSLFYTGVLWIGCKYSFYMFSLVEFSLLIWCLM